MKKRILITGLGGTLGRALARISISNNYQVAGTIHNQFPNELQRFVDKKLLKVFRVNLMSIEDTNKIIQDFRPQAIFHFAGKVLGRSDKQTLNPQVYRENIQMFQNVLQAAIKFTPNTRFILSSGCLVYNKPTPSDPIQEILSEDLPIIDINKEPYRASKLNQEKYLKETNLDYIITRPTQFTGEGKASGVIEWHIACETLKIQKGEKKKITVINKLSEVDLLDVRDVAAAYLILLEKSPAREIYHISSGKAITVEELTKIFLKIVGMSDDYPVESAGVEEGVYFRFSPQKLNNLGWKPKFTVKDALTSYWEYFKKQ